MKAPSPQPQTQSSPSPYRASASVTDKTKDPPVQRVPSLLESEIPTDDFMYEARRYLDGDRLSVANSRMVTAIVNEMMHQPRASDFDTFRYLVRAATLQEVLDKFATKRDPATDDGRRGYLDGQVDLLGEIRDMLRSCKP